MNILFIAGFGPISRNPQQSERFYHEALGITFERDGEYIHTGAIEGDKHFAVWPLSQAAQSCFGTTTWPGDVAIPQAWVEFDVDDVSAATQELADKGYQLLISGRREPWGQVVSRLLSPEGLLVGITYTPGMRSK